MIFLKEVCLFLGQGLKVLFCFLASSKKRLWRLEELYFRAVMALFKVMVFKVFEFIFLLQVGLLQLEGGHAIMDYWVTAVFYA